MPLSRRDKCTFRLHLPALTHCIITENRRHGYLPVILGHDQQNQVSLLERSVFCFQKLQWRKAGCSLHWTNPSSWLSKVYCKRLFLMLNLPFQLIASIYHPCGEECSYFLYSNFFLYLKTVHIFLQCPLLWIKGYYWSFWVFSVLQALFSYTPSLSGAPLWTGTSGKALSHLTNTEIPPCFSEATCWCIPPSRGSFLQQRVNSGQFDIFCAIPASRYSTVILTPPSVHLTIPT